LDFWKRHSIWLTNTPDGVLNLQIAQTLKQGSGKIHGTDFSAAMIKTSQEKALKANVTDICTFEGLFACYYLFSLKKNFLLL